MDNSTKSALWVAGFCQIPKEIPRNEKRWVLCRPLPGDTFQSIPSNASNNVSSSVTLDAEKSICSCIFSPIFPKKTVCIPASFARKMSLLNESPTKIAVSGLTPNCFILYKKIPGSGLKMCTSPAITIMSKYPSIPECWLRYLCSTESYALVIIPSFTLGFILFRICSTPLNGTDWAIKTFLYIDKYLSSTGSHDLRRWF